MPSFTVAGDKLMVYMEFYSLSYLK
jgi:hypothetical protein